MKAGATRRQAASHAKKNGSKRGFVGSTPFIIAVIIVGVLAVGGALDAATNLGRAYGNVSVNGVSVAGMNEPEMQDALRSTFAPRIAQAQVTIYADEEARAKGRSTLEELEAAAIADQQSYEEAIASNDWWQTDALSLKASMSYSDAIAEALAVGREDGGLLERVNLMFNPRDIELDVTFDEEALDSLASEIDETIGDERKDASVYVEGSNASAVEGHDGKMVDRAWLADKISDAMIKDSVPDSFVAQVSDAPSRITMEQAREMAERVKVAISTTARFSYEDKSFTVGSAELGNWTVVSTVPDGQGGYRLQPALNADAVIPAVVKGTNAAVTSQDTEVRFEKSGDSVIVRTSGSGDIPKTSEAVSQLDEEMYGANGILWDDEAPSMLSIEIGKSDKPEELTFSDALDLGVITEIGEYTTEFSNYEGTENRNHNIKLAADILNDCIIGADGGIWDFNTESGDTNEEAGFWSAGSIIDGEYQDSIGGGICQVATTIFNAVYEAGLDVVERHNHSLYIASYPTGRDASVSYPELDFTWKNQLDSDIFMTLDYTDTSLTATLYSVYTGYSAETETGEWEDGEKYSTRFEVDPSLGDGASYLKTTGEDGSKISVTRTVHDADGKVISQTLFQSIYEAKDEIYVVGANTDTSALVRKTDSSSASAASAQAGDDDYVS